MFKFRKADSIGAASAEDDAEFLRECFVDTGNLAQLQDLTNNRVIILGRTGSGKSALLSELESELPGKVIRVSAESLALTYVANSTILGFFTQIGVNLDPFFKLLWRHVLVVELLSRHFGEEGDVDGKLSLQNKLLRLFVGASKRERDMRQAVAYLAEWGKSFWLDTEFRVREITQQIESKLDAGAKAALGSKAAAITATANVAERFSAEERAELIHRGQDIVTAAQVKDLQVIVSLIDAVLDDPQNPYYLVIDGLDEDWVEDRLRYKLIMALIQTARDFFKVRHAKVAVALRRDLIDRVFRLTRDSGFQEEKYHSLYLPLVWNQDEILRILDARVNRLVSRRYTKGSVSYADLLPKRFRSLPIGEYIFGIAKRPRDVIAWFNTCILTASDEPKLTAQHLKLAEGEYSRARLRALADEWSGDYPTLLEFAKVLSGRGSSFKLESITRGQIEELCLVTASENPRNLGMLHGAMSVVDLALDANEFRRLLFRAFYHVGLVGLKLSPFESASWVDELGRSVSFAEMIDSIGVVVNPTYHRALGIRDAA